MRRALIFLAMATVVAAPAAAQDRKWEIEGYAGLIAGQAVSAGSLSLPAAGAPIVTSNPTFPSRETPSWLFGDGAALLNGAMESFGLSNRITPLDVVLGPLGGARVPAFGARLRRRLTPRTSLEVSVDAASRSVVQQQAVERGIDATASTFVDAFNALFHSGPFSAIVVTELLATVTAPYRETGLTLGFNMDLDPAGPFVPYLTFGGGAVIASGTLPSATLQGRYRALILGEVPLEETDRVALRYTRKTTPAGVLGGGLRRDLGAAWRVRIDARVSVARDTTRVHLDASPAAATGVPAGFIELATNPALQFSNDPSTGRRSSLSAAPIRNVEVFSGGYLARTLISVSLSRRF